MRKGFLKKVHTVLLLTGLTCLLLSGCGKETLVTETVIDSVDSSLSEDHGITIYRVEGRSVVAEEERFQPKQPDSLASSLEETMAVIPMTEGVRFVAYSMAEENSVTLSLQVESSVSRETLLLEKAALIGTLEQIRSIGSMTLSIKDEEGRLIEENTYSGGSFYYYDRMIPTGQNNGQIRLYLPDEKRETLSEVTLNVTLQLDVSVEEEVVNQLIRREVFPAGTDLISISVTQKVAYVDLTRQFAEGTDAMAVYSLVDSVVALPHISSVQILVEGEKQEEIGTVDTHVPLSFQRP